MTMSDASPTTGPGAPPVDDLHGADEQATDRDQLLAVRQEQFRAVAVEVTVWIGKTRKTLGELAQLRPGDVIALDSAIGAPVEILLNREVVIARGDVVDMGDQYGVRITEIVSDGEG